MRRTITCQVSLSNATLHFQETLLPVSMEPVLILNKAHEHMLLPDDLWVFFGVTADGPCYHVPKARVNPHDPHLLQATHLQPPWIHQRLVHIVRGSGLITRGHGQMLTYRMDSVFRNQVFVFCSQ